MMTMAMVALDDDSWRCVPDDGDGDVQSMMDMMVMMGRSRTR